MGKKNVSVRAKTIKLLKKNIQENLHDIGFGDVFLNRTPKAQTTTKAN